MAKQTINIGAVANDGTGTNLRAGAIIVNDNFNEIYTALGNGSSITLTATPTELNLLSGATAIVTANNSVVFTNKTISGSNNTLSNIGNSSLTNSSFSIRDDSSSAISIALGGTLKIKSNDGITTTVSQGDTVTISLDSNILTETSTDVLTNKTISASNNTITNLTNTNLSGTAGITNANLANPFIQFSDESSTVNSTALGGKLEFLAGEGINTIVGASSLTISAELATSSNAGVATFNTASFLVTSGDVTIKSAGVTNTQLVNSTITLGSTSTALGATTSSVAGLSLTGSANTIDLTSSGNKLRFNFANTGAFPNATTYQGLFAVATGVAKAYFADSGAYNELLSENSSIKDLSDVGSANPTNGQVLIFNSGTGRYEPGAQSAGGTVTSVATGTGLSGGPITSTGTILIDTASTFQGAATIDVTNNGFGAYQFNSHYSGDNPTLYLRAGHTYALNLAVTGHPFHLQTVSGAYSAGNPYTTGLTHVATDGTVTTGASALLKVTGVLYIEVPSGSSSTIFYACQFHGAMAGKIVLGPITNTFTGDGSTIGYTINSGRNVNDVLAIVNGIILVPTTDYTISGTTITFQLAPSASSEIQIRYL
jgi:hypothetical protein